ncbi:hypothetical protein [Paucilactobacillus sp. N302-9]
MKKFAMLSTILIPLVICSLLVTLTLTQSITGRWLFLTWLVAFIVMTAVISYIVVVLNKKKGSK